MKYSFREIKCCEMCGDSADGHKVLGQRLNQSQGLNPCNKSGISVSVCKCHHCGLIYAQPQPIPLDINDHYGVDPNEYWDSGYFTPDPLCFLNEIATLKRLGEVSSQRKDVLDIGAGIGKCMLAFEANGFNAYGLEPTEAFYKKAISDMGIAENNLKLATIESVSYRECQFDIITFGAVFEHLEHPVAALEKALYWLKPNGLIHLEVPSSRYFIAKLINAYFRLRGTNYVTHLSPMHIPFHLYEFDIKSFIALSEKLGFEVVEHEYYVCQIFGIPKFFHKPLKWYMKYTHTGMQLALYLKKSE